ncbi:MAG TPA: HlyD family efflux transporter periplasmic adaptor subunit [Saprospiraceae bacterium]|nr:HlyD family efflux transporter periplasmic adaptor subunit [Saprospiraceae bacterium]HMQ82302.1 HlyD family efflux transporter periplasmic adaptor subunit [Saprospiraceae bacterium]
MDREIPLNIVRKRKGRSILIATFLLAVLFGIAYATGQMLKPKVYAAEIEIDTVRMGVVENTLSASGEVQPLFEQIIASPISAAIKIVFLTEGAAVQPGDPIMELDKQFLQIEFEKLKKQLELKQTNIAKLKLELDKSYFDLVITDSIKAFRINALKADREYAQRLLKAGGGTKESVEKIENDLHIAKLEKQQLENDLKSRQSIIKASIQESIIDASIQEKDLEELEGKLQQASITASRAGVLTYVNKNLGLKVSEGDILVRLADLGSYKIKGSISDNYLDQIQVGMPALVTVGGEKLSGSLTQLNPAINNNVVEFELILEEPNHSLLRPKQKVEIELITASQNKVLCVRNGAAFAGAKIEEVFVLQGDGTAKRQQINTGFKNAQLVEITQGLKEGDRVIVSDMSKFKNTPSIKIQGLP